MVSMLLQARSNKPGASTITLVDPAGADTGYRLLSGFDLGDAVWEMAFSGTRGTQGAAAAGGSLPNRIVNLPLRVTGASKDDLLAKVSTINQLGDELRRFGGVLTWQSKNASRKTYIDVLGGGAQLSDWLARSEHSNIADVVIAAACKPYVRGESMDILDDFSSDTVNAATPDYAADAGAFTNIAVAGGLLTAVANLTTENRLIHTARGYTYGDHQVTGKTTPGATITGYKFAVELKRTAVDTYLEVYVDDDGANSRLRLDKIVAGARTNLSSTNLAARIVNGTPFWVRGRIEGNVVYLEHFTAAPTPMGAPTTTTSYTLTVGAEVTAFGYTVEGRGGFAWTPRHASATVDDFTVEPFTYRNSTLPDNFKLRGVIPGDAPALIDAYITPSGGASAPRWALIGWASRAAHNFLTDGSFDSTLWGGGQWSTAAVANINGAATSKGPVNTAAKYGTRSLQVVCPATADTGVSLRIFRRFQRGVTYTFEVWVQAPGAVTNVYARIGNGVANDKASSANVALSTSWQKITVSWTPSADRDDAHVAVNIAAATGTTFNLDGAVVYEGTVAPTSANQIEGYGGPPPFGVLEAENSTNGGSTADATYRSGFGRIVAAGNAGADPIVDPALLLPDDYTQSEVAVEVWARVLIGTAATGYTLVAKGYGGLTDRYTEEWGAAVKPTNGTSADRFRFIRLGVVRLPTDKGLFRLVVDVGAGGGNSGIDYLMAVPANSRALMPTGKVSLGFPDFVGTTTETMRRIRPDGSGTARSYPVPEEAAGGLGGSLLEFPPGDVDVVVKLCSLIPDMPGETGANEQLAHSATVRFGVTPRYMTARPS